MVAVEWEPHREHIGKEKQEQLGGLRGAFAGSKWSAGVGYWWDIFKVRALRGP